MAASAALRAGDAAVEVDADDYDHWLRTPVAVESSSAGDDRYAAARARAAGLGTIVELPTRAIIEWTPAQVRNALLDADTGMMRTAADLVEAIMGDDRVQGVLATRTHGLLGLPMQFFGDPDAVAQLEGVRHLEGQPAIPGDWHRMFPQAELARFAAWGILLGVAVAERVPDDEREIGDPAAPRMRVWHPRWLRYQWDIDQWFLTTAAGEVPITPGDGRWILYTPYGSTRPWTMGAWRPIAFAWVMKQFALHDRARHSEVQGSPARVGRAPQGATDKMRRRFLSDLRALGRDAAFVLPEGYEYSIVEATGRTWEIYGAQVEWADRAIAITLAGQFVTTEGTKGFSNGDIHNEIRLELIQFTAESLTECLHDQGLCPWAAENFGSARRAPHARWDTSPPVDKQTLATALATLGDAITKLDAALTASGKRVDALAMANRFGLPTVARLVAQAPQAQPMAPPIDSPAPPAPAIQEAA